MKLARCVTAAFVLSVAAACDDVSSTPSAPTLIASEPRPPIPSPPPVTGEINLAASTPVSGATLTLHDCPVLKGVKSHSTGPVWCTDDLNLEFSIVVDRDVQQARLLLTFVTAEGRECAFAVSPSSSLASHRPTSLRTSTTEFRGLETDPSAPPNLGCETLPTVTRSLRAQLMDVSASPSGVSMLSGAFALTYTFARPQ